MRFKTIYADPPWYEVGGGKIKRSMELIMDQIPNGLYCYSIENNKKTMCPYWKMVGNDGYCEFLHKSDYDINEEIGILKGYKGNGKEVTISAHDIKASLLWDQCKECDINIDESEME